MSTVYYKKCSKCGYKDLHEWYNECPLCKHTPLIEDLEKRDAKPIRYDRNKGRSLVSFPCDYIVIDIETTGLSPKWDEIIELAALKIVNNEIVKEFSTLIKPREKIDSFITKLTGITNEMVKDAPKIKKVLPDFINFVGDNILIAHNANFDINFIYDDYKGYLDKEFSNNFVCTMRIAQKHCELPNHKLKTIAGFYNIDVSGHHRGLADCKITNQIFQALKNDILSKYENEKEFHKKNWHSFSVSEIMTDKIVFNECHFLYGKNCTFTGTLEKMQRKDAMQKVVDLGGKVLSGLTKETNCLIVGTQDYSKTKESGKSLKILKAEKYILEGQDIQILSEDVFCDLISENEAVASD